MQIASQTFNPELLNRTPPGSPPVATIKPQKIKLTDPRNRHPGEKQKDLINTSGTSAHERGPENGPPPSPEENMTTSPTGSGLMEDQTESMEPHNSSSSSTQNPVGEEKDIPTKEADLAQDKQQEVSLSPTLNKTEEVTEEIQADLEENKQEEEDKVDTFFSTMSHRYEAL